MGAWSSGRPVGRRWTRRQDGIWLRDLHERMSCTLGSRSVTSRLALLGWRCARYHFFIMGEIIMDRYIATHPYKTVGGTLRDTGTIAGQPADEGSFIAWLRNNCYRNKPILHNIKAQQRNIKRRLWQSYRKLLQRCTKLKHCDVEFFSDTSIQGCYHVSPWPWPRGQIWWRWPWSWECPALLLALDPLDFA